MKQEFELLMPFSPQWIFTRFSRLFLGILKFFLRFPSPFERKLEASDTCCLSGDFFLLSTRLKSARKAKSSAFFSSLSPRQLTNPIRLAVTKGDVWATTWWFNGIYWMVRLCVSAFASLFAPPLSFLFTFSRWGGKQIHRVSLGR